MQANQTQILNYTMTVPASTVIQTVNTTIVRPDGTAINSIGTFTSVSQNPALRNLSTIYTPLTGGRYTGTWNVVDTAGQSYTYPFYFWVVWTDVYDGIRQLLGSNVASIADTILDREFRNIDTELRDYTNSALPNYWQFNLAYQMGYDQGMEKLVAARVRPYIGGKRPTGEVSLFKKGTTTIQYTNGSPQMLKPLELQWVEQGMTILEANIPEIYGIALQDRTGDEVMSRGDRAIGNRHPLAPWNTDLNYGYSIDNDFWHNEY